MARTDRELREAIAAEAEHAEATRDADLPYRRRGSGAGTSVYGLRLSDDRIAQLRRLAATRGVEPSALARQWIIDRLDAADHPRTHATEQWERDLRATTEHLRQLLDQQPWPDAS
jgi:aryl-alcohol dehydrogenase-like predicted oxidoreductase